ncbi:nuclease-like protein [Paenibacillus cellulosilyticus]|uniref:Nuclease-like protein n=1 Tax=Paenibacillus cellulosilyticus TaxID=375489 RepID=A0A2V2YSG7_9BACL|nr:nuclease-related domain-containing protein [Paenibacillus cellulosilyticus]PWV98527.1 nuclease-like protein [Paenibacillus cellulosilyticus]QKS44135.1 NERD domain-containing protein [Paenibacillus cellulosilyticus]
MLSKLMALFKNEPSKKKASTSINTAGAKKKPSQKKVEAGRIGEIGEYKINIQLDQLPKDCTYLSDLLLPNSKSRTGYSQIDHLVISPFGLFVIETKNYNGEIKGTRSDKYWSVSNRFKMYNPLMQNYGHIKALEAQLGEYKSAKYISMISFTMRCRFSIDPELRKIHSDELIVYDVELSEFINRKILRLKAELPAEIFSGDDTRRIYEKINNINIVDPQIRAEHVHKMKSGKTE